MSQVIAKGLLYLGMNTAGLFIHYLTDHAQRQVFLETRRCIEGRLRLEQENQRQVQSLLLLTTIHSVMTITVLQTLTKICHGNYKNTKFSLLAFSWLYHPLSNMYCFATQERLVLSILPRFVALEMIADMSSLEDELSPHEFYKIYIHQYKDVRYAHIKPGNPFVLNSLFYLSQLQFVC